MTQILLYYNHLTETAFPIREALKAACHELRQGDEDGSSLLQVVALDHRRERERWLDQCRVVVVHGFPKHLGEAEITDAEKWDKWIASPKTRSTDGLVVIRVSTGHLYDLPRKIPFGPVGRTRYLLSVWETKDSGLSAKIGDDGWDAALRKWTQLLAIAVRPAMLDQWFAGNRWEPEFAILDELFGSARSKEFLSALAILCQGYLAVYACNEQIPKVGKFERALRVMGWLRDVAKVDKDDSGEILTICSEVAKEKALAVTNQGWWSGIVGAEEQVVLGHLRAELGDRPVTEMLRQLVEQICSPKTEGLDLDAVSAAYLELADLLEGRR